MQWRVLYSDGRSFTEQELKSSDMIDRSLLKEFRLIQGEKTIFIAYFNDGKRKLIFRKRHVLNIDGKEKDLVYLVGWHENVNGTSVKSICYIHSDGMIEFDDSRNNLELTKFEI